ncbi:DUF2752 domain-containing protein [Candidatus Sumerlaeota bacterium]|nr:DUF2752 domain-containing protein [Candidatus Sumerlaeota bacterium]
MSQAESLAEASPAPPAETPTMRQRIVAFVHGGSNGFSLGLTNRWTCLIMLAGLMAAILLPSTGLGIPMCYMKSTTGIPCPGCGLTRSVTSVFHGHLPLAFQYNPFGLFVGALFALLGPLFFLPNRLRLRLQAFLKPHDPVLFGTSMLVLALFVVFGVVRIFLVEFRAPGFEWWKSAAELPPAALADSPQHSGNK